MQPHFSSRSSHSSQFDGAAWSVLAGRFLARLWTGIMLAIVVPTLVASGSGLAQSVTVPVRVTDQHGVELLGSWFRTSSGTDLATGTLTTLPVGSQEFTIRPALSPGRLPYLSRTDVVEITEATTSVNLTWITSQVTFRVEDQHGVETSGNTSKPASWEWVKTGQSRVRGRCLCSESLIRRKS